MTINDFLFMVESIGSKWTLTEDGEVTSENENCPIWELYRSSDRYIDEDADEAEDVYQAGREIGLTDRQIMIVMSAADNRQPFNPRVRRKMLELVADATKPQEQQS